MARFSFNPSDAPEITMPQRGPLPPGDYPVMITNSDLRTTQAGTGQYISLELQVTDGEFSGRRLWENLNVSNPNKQAEDIAKSALRQICNIAGINVMEDTSELHEIPMIATVVLDKKDPSRNRIVGYSSAQAAPAKPHVQPKPVAGAARPWQR